MKHLVLGGALFLLCVAPAACGLSGSVGGGHGGASAGSTTETGFTTTPSITAASTGTGTGLPVSCADYCMTLNAACTATNAEYLSTDICLAMCSDMNPGQPGDTSGDSLACRFQRAQLALTSPATHCQEAGPVAEGPCASPCTAFCELDLDRCGPVGLFPYADLAACQAACAGFPYLLSTAPGADGGLAGDVAFVAGNTLNCRIYHLEAAYDPASPAAAMTHCPHTAAASATCN